MGIRFHCPQGHKLNVKSFLAGKRGFCPKCGAKITVPLESEPKRPNAAEATETAEGSSIVVRGSASKRDPSTATDKQAAPPPLPGSSKPVRPSVLDKAPDAAWYVSSEPGVRQGPLPADEIRKRLDDGLLTAETLMWREGWSSWESAASVFPEQFLLPAGLETTSIELSSISRPDVAAGALQFDDEPSDRADGSRDNDGLSRPARARISRKYRSRRIAMAVLLLVVVTLVPVVWFVISMQ